MMIMPMGEYKDFADCVSKNQDKENPEAYCGTIKAKTEELKKDEKDKLEKEKDRMTKIAKEETIIYTSAVGQQIFIEAGPTPMPTKPANPGMKWVQTARGNWEQVKIQAPTKGEQPSKPQTTVATPEDAKKYLKVLQKKMLNAKTPLEQKEIESEMQYVIKDIKKMQGQDEKPKKLEIGSGVKINRGAADLEGSTGIIRSFRPDGTVVVELTNGKKYLMDSYQLDYNSDIKEKDIKGETNEKKIKGKIVEFEEDIYDKIDSYKDLKKVANLGGWNNPEDMLNEMDLSEDDVIGKWLSYTAGHPDVKTEDELFDKMEEEGIKQ